MSNTRTASVEATKRELRTIEQRIRAARGSVHDTDEDIQDLQAMREELLARLGGASVAEAEAIGDEAERR